MTEKILLNLEIQDKKSFEIFKFLMEKTNRDTNRELERVLNDYIQDTLSEIEAIL